MIVAWLYFAMAFLILGALGLVLAVWVATVTPEKLMMVCDAIDQASHTVIWLFLVVGSITITVCVATLFAFLGIRRLVRRVTRGTWNSVLVSAERRALR